MSHATPTDALPPVESLAGPALAEAVAVEVMGWRWFLWPQRGAIALHHPDLSKREMWAPHFIDVTDAQQEYERFCDWDRYVPDYPNDIAAAMQVVDYLHARRNPVSMIYLTGCLDDHDAFAWQVTFRRDDGHAWAADVSLPTAICRAALKALRAGWEVH